MLVLSDREQRSVISEIKCYSQKHPEDEGLSTRFIEFISANKDCFSRSCTFGHVTVSAWMENQSGDRFLLTKHKKFKRWLQLGGHIENSSDLLLETFREIKEESGLTNLRLKTRGIFDLGLCYVPDFQKVRAHYHYDVRFLVTALQSEDDIRISDESDDLQWFENVPSGSEDLQKMFTKWKKLRTRLI